MSLLVPKKCSAAAVHCALLPQSRTPAQKGERVAEASTDVRSSSLLGLPQARKKREFSPKRRGLWAEPGWKGRQGAKLEIWARLYRESLAEGRSGTVFSTSA